MNTFSIKASEIRKHWVLIDAKDLIVGRVSVEIAKILRGKHKPTYTPHMDCGDNVIVINANHLVFTGSKMFDKIYYRHTGYPGGLKSTTPKALIGRGFADRVLRLSVKRMLGRGPMARKRLSNLYIYNEDTHPHAGRQPMLLDLAKQNVKNKRRQNNESNED